MKTVSKLFCASVSSILLFACAAKPLINDAPAINALAPMENPGLTLNQRVYSLNKKTGNEVYHVATSIDENGFVSGVSDGNCTWKSRAEGVAPTFWWKNCGDNPQWASGENRGLSKQGELWPLTVGNTVSYSYELIDATGKSHGSRQMNCEVDSQVSVDVAAGLLDAFRVVCKTQEGSNLKTDYHYFSPELKQKVKRVQLRSEEQEPRRHTEYLRTEAL